MIVAEDVVETDVGVAAVPETANPLPIVETVVHMDDDGAGCGFGVLGSPWKNVEVP